MPKYLFLLPCLFYAFSASAQEAFLDDDMGLDFDSSSSSSTFNEPKKTESIDSQKSLSSFISSRLPVSAAKNIEKAEKVFCYTVDYPSADYTGYVVNDMAITGSCGELSKDDDVKDEYDRIVREGEESAPHKWEYTRSDVFPKSEKMTPYHNHLLLDENGKAFFKLDCTYQLEQHNCCHSRYGYREQYSFVEIEHDGEQSCADCTGNYPCKHQTPPNLRLRLA
jgi:hypothetical protein